jgi:hypothetical protein
MKKVIFIFLLIISFIDLCFSQNKTDKLKEKINAEIEIKVKKLRIEVESNIMNPNTKEIYSTMAIDTFEIENYTKQILTYLSFEESLALLKNNTMRYNNMMNKYYELAKKECNEIERIELIKSQNAWENFKEKELIWFSKRLKKSPTDYNYDKEYCKIIKQRMLNMFFYYTDLLEN